MQCPYCNIPNDDEYIYCVNCGRSIHPAPNAAETEQFSKPIAGPGPTEGSPSVVTQFRKPSGFGQIPTEPANHSQVNYETTPQFDVPQSKHRGKLWFGLAVIALLIIGSGGFAAFVLIKQNLRSEEVLPDHLGMFYQNKEKTQLAELRRFELVNALDAKDKIGKDDAVPVTGEQPEMILYADGNELLVADLKLVVLDSLKNDGTMKQIDFQVSPVDEKPAMKRLRFADSLAIGKYAFAKFDGYFDEGKHKFWGFEVKSGEKRDNGTLAREVSIAPKPKPTPTPETQTAKLPLVAGTPVIKQAPIIPTGAKQAFCNDSNVVVRGAPGLYARKISGLNKGQRIYVIQYSSNTDYWRGMQANWAYIQTEGGKTGWVFSPFISY